VVVVTPTSLGWATQETQFYQEEFDRAWSLIPETSTEDDAVRSFVTSVLGGPDSVGVVDPGSAFWLLLRFDGTSTEFTFGDPGDLLMIGDWDCGDWDCDGIATPGVWRLSNGDLHLRNSNSAGEADFISSFSEFEAVPVVGDSNGNGCDNVSFYLPSEGLVRIFNTPEAEIDSTDGTTPSDIDYLFGKDGDVPFAGDFDGDGIDTIGLFRPSTGVFYLKNTHTDGPADIEFPSGAAGDVPIAGDWGVDDGVDTVAVYRPDT
jgi:hypothetical protein